MKINVLDLQLKLRPVPGHRDSRNRTPPRERCGPARPHSPGFRWFLPWQRKGHASPRAAISRRARVLSLSTSRAGRPSVLEVRGSSGPDARLLRCGQDTVRNYPGRNVRCTSSNGPLIGGVNSVLRGEHRPCQGDQAPYREGEGRKRTEPGRECA